MADRLPQRQAFERSPRTARIAPCRQPSASASASASGLAWPLALARAPYRRRPSVNRLVGEPLADNAFQRAVGAGHIVNAKFDPVAIAEIELGQIAVQVLFLAMLIDALHAALEDRIVAFGGVGVGVEAGHAVGVAVFVAAMIDGRMVGELAANLGVMRRFVGHKVRLARDVLAHDRRDVRDGRAVDMKRTGRAAAFHKGQHRHLVMAASADGLALLAANESFVRFDSLAFAAHRREAAVAHRLANAMAHEPGGFQGDAEGAVKLVSADPFLRRTNQMDCLKPKAKWNVARLENGSDFDGERLPAG